MSNDQLSAILTQLDAPQVTFSELDAYAAGNQPLAFLTSEARAALGKRFGRMASNIPRLAVIALAERLRVTGFAGADIWPDWIASDLDQTSGILHREALTLGTGYVLVWADAAGRPRASVESARQVACLTDPGSRQVVAAAKRWETGGKTHAVLYGRDEIVRYVSNTPGATLHGYKVAERIKNPLGVVPMVRFSNSDRLLDSGASEITDLMPLVDALNKTLTDLLVSSEYFARPRRWATGIELVEEPVLDDDGNETGEMIAVNPIPENDRAMVSEQTETKFGQLPAGDVSGYTSAVDVLLGQISAVSGLPPHYLGVTSSNPASADALRAAEASLTARAAARQSVFGRSWEQVARLLVAVRDGVDPAGVDARVTWADPGTRSIAQEANAVVKLHQAGLLPSTYALKRLGYDSDEIAEIRTATRAEALDKAGVDVLAKVIA